MTEDELILSLCREAGEEGSEYGIPVTMPQLAQGPEAAVSIGEKMGCPIVIKVVSPDISHKSDVGGVIIGIDSNAALKEVYEKLMQRVKRRAPEAAIAGVAVEKMITTSTFPSVRAWTPAVIVRSTRTVGGAAVRLAFSKSKANFRTLLPSGPMEILFPLSWARSSYVRLPR